MEENKGNVIITEDTSTDRNEIPPDNFYKEIVFEELDLEDFVFEELDLDEPSAGENDSMGAVKATEEAESAGTVKTAEESNSERTVKAAEETVKIPEIPETTESVSKEISTEPSSKSDNTAEESDEADKPESEDGLDEASEKSALSVDAVPRESSAESDDTSKETKVESASKSDDMSAESHDDIAEDDEASEEAHEEPSIETADASKETSEDSTVRSDDTSNKTSEDSTARSDDTSNETSEDSTANADDTSKESSEDSETKSDASSKDATKDSETKPVDTAKDVPEDTETQSENTPKENPIGRIFKKVVSFLKGIVCKIKGLVLKIKGLNRKILRRVVICFGVIVVAVYGGGALWFRYHFQLNTSVFGEDISLMSVQEAKDSLRDTVQLSSIEIIGRDLDQDIDISDAKVYYSFDGLSEALADQNELAWPLMLRETSELSLPYTLEYDEEKLRESLENNSLFDEDSAIKPQDALVSYDEESSQYVIVPEVEGNLINKERLYEAVAENLAENSLSVNLEESNVYEEPSLRQDDQGLLNNLELLNTFNSLKVSVDLGGDTLEYVSMDQLFSFIADDCTVQEEPLRQYIAELAQKYDTYDESVLKPFITHDGRTVSLKAEYGWELNQEETYAALYQLVAQIASDYESLLVDGGHADREKVEEAKAANSMATASDAAESEAIENPGETAQSVEGTADVTTASEASDSSLVPTTEYTIQAIWDSEAASHQGNDYGNTYVEVDMGQQQVYVFVNGTLVLETPCVTGRMSGGRATPDGIYSIKSKQRSRTLTGRNAYGAVTYRSFVNYWMPFNGGVGLHDATWRSRFGGNIYVSGGSHGCVNLPLANARALFDIVYVGMPVICYY